MTLPKWVGELKNQRDRATSHDEVPDCSLVIEALAVAIEALENIQKVARIEYAHSFSRSALAEIEKMGEGK